MQICYLCGPTSYQNTHLLIGVLLFVSYEMYTCNLYNSISAELHASGQVDSQVSVMHASHCFCLTLPTGNIRSLTLLTCLFVQPIDAHNFNIFLFDTRVTADRNCRTWLLAGAARGLAG